MRFYERYGRRLPGWTAVLFMVLLALALADLFWTLLPQPESAAWRPAPASTSTLSASGVRKDAAVDIAAIQAAHLFGEVKADTSVGALLDAPETRLNLKLLGVLAFDSDEKLSRALIELQPGDEKPFGIGATVMSGTSLQAILPDRVVLSRAGKLETLFLEKTQSREGITLDQPANPDTAGDGNPVALTQIRQELLQDPSKASEYLRVQPANKDGKLRGYRIYPGKDRSIFSQAGLKPGDLVTQVNGVELDDASKALKMLSELKDTNQFDLVVERGGQSQTINVNLN